jgi:DNA-binding transcriptional regulator/RsmH inhibitor MraZ
MLQSGRNRLYNIAYTLDNKERVIIPDKGALHKVPEALVLKRRMQEKTSDLRIIFTEQELAEIAEEIRRIVSEDESRNCNDYTFGH